MDSPRDAMQFLLLGRKRNLHVVILWEIVFFFIWDIAFSEFLEGKMKGWFCLVWVWFGHVIMFLFLGSQKPEKPKKKEGIETVIHLFIIERVQVFLFAHWLLFV